jgi:hypothetical protein
MHPYKKGNKFEYRRVNGIINPSNELSQMSSDEDDSDESQEESKI